MVERAPLEHAVTRDAPIKPGEEVFAGGMGQTGQSANTMDAHISLRMEGSVVSMDQRNQYAIMKGAQKVPSKEGYALSMGPRLKVAATKDVPIELSKEVSAIIMGQRQSANPASIKDALTLPRLEESV
mmetsp:Transcript_22981/g.40345  ORF Transcript_22981/g.40345 Transcript_22981/m.40345 type:complete len:128 (-) Transcript_22981:392-775(-)